MTGRVVAVPVTASLDGEDDRPAGLLGAMLEDVVDMVSVMPEVEALLMAAPGAAGRADAVAWPGTTILPVVDLEPTTVFAAMPATASVGCIVAADAPDLPPLLLGKLFSALTTAEVACCPAADGGLVALAVRLPAPGWFATAGVRLDDTDALDRLQAAAPTRAALAVGPGWHRVRRTADLSRLDPGLEGWDCTRAWSGR
jgi:hypothetical protein